MYIAIVFIHFKIIYNLNKQYDYIILGAGCAGLSLLVRLIASGQCEDKKILLIDKECKNTNDRTWCFWEKEPGYFEDIVHHQWKKLYFKHPLESIDLAIAPYTYKMIQSIDFYNYCFYLIKKNNNIEFLQGEVTRLDAEKGIAYLGNQQYAGNYIFSSFLSEPLYVKHNQHHLLQHFRGWWIETTTAIFDPAAADIMNFNTSQQYGCAFVYVLPVSKRKALVEYTLFTESILKTEQYDEGLYAFIKDALKIEHFSITRVEQGIIPMTNTAFPKQQGKVYYIGTAGGQTKASTGYTFQFIQKQSATIVDNLLHNRPLILPKVSKRFHFYDSVFLRVLHERKLNGSDIFCHMFKKNKAFKVLQFLDNETSLIEELAIMHSTKKRIFFPAAIREACRL